MAIHPTAVRPDGPAPSVQAVACETVKALESSTGHTQGFPVRHT